MPNMLKYAIIDPFLETHPNVLQQDRQKCQSERMLVQSYVYNVCHPGMYTGDMPGWVSPTKGADPLESRFEGLRQWIKSPRCFPGATFQ